MTLLRRSCTVFDSPRRSAYSAASLAGAGIGGIALVPLQRPMPRRCWYFVWNPRRDTPGLHALIDRLRAFSTTGKGPVQGLREMLDR